MGSTAANRPDIGRLRQWVGRQETAEDVIAPIPAAALSAILDRGDPPGIGDPLPPLWHWLYFLTLHRQSDLGPDGHARRGGFLPPVDLPRRMWAAGRLDFRRPLRIGDAARRVSTIRDVQLKSGRTGPLVFVTVEHAIENGDGPALVEEHDIVYRAAPQVGDPTPQPSLAPRDAAWSRTIRPDDVLLVRYSAVTFNGHRIHFDRRHATEVEGYPGLVVHGPLTATLMMDLLRRHLPNSRVDRFEFRAIRPLFDTEPFIVAGAADGPTIRLWAADSAGWLAMQGTATLA
jgi:3-methylfumaryl-CoA hydratase